jgi:hypothetical protein
LPQHRIDSLRRSWFARREGGWGGLVRSRGRWMTVPGDLFNANCESDRTIHTKCRKRSPASGCEAEDADTFPTKMVAPALTPGMVERHGATGFRISCRSSRGLPEGTGDASQCQIVERGCSAARLGIYVIDVKRGFLPLLGQSAILATVARSHDNCGAQSNGYVLHRRFVELPAVVADSERRRNNVKRSATSTRPSASCRSPAVRGDPLS